MTYVLIPALTFGGALLFFAAGLLAARASRLSPARPSLPVMGELTRLDPEGGDSDLRTETVDRHQGRHNGHHPLEVGAGVVGAAGDERAERTVADGRVEMDEDDARALFERVLFAESDARSTRQELQQQTTRSEELQRDVDELTEQLLRIQRQPLTRATPRPGPPAPSVEVEAALGRERQRTKTLERELVSLQTQLVQTPEADVVAALRRDLMVAREQLRARQGLADRATAENARQKGQLGELVRARAELTRLRAENGELRARGLVAPKPKRPPPLPATVRPPATRSSGQTLQALVDDIASRDEVRAAVVADEMGLVVAASGENSDAMAAVGAVVSRATAQVGHLLPIGLPRVVTLRDDHDLTVTVRPFDAEGRNLLLLTLALGDTRDDAGPAEPAGPGGPAGPAFDPSAETPPPTTTSARTTP